MKRFAGRSAAVSSSLQLPNEEGLAYHSAARSHLVSRARFAIAFLLLFGHVPDRWE